MKLQEFIENKINELKQEYKQVELIRNVSVMLNRNSVGESFLSTDTPLDQEGREVNIHEIEEIPSIPYAENGTLVRIGVKPPRKRKFIEKDYYFMWE